MGNFYESVNILPRKVKMKKKVLKNFDEQLSTFKALLKKA
jgi:hypothetical protein